MLIPNYTGTNSRGETVQLHDYRRQKNLVAILTGAKEYSSLTPLLAELAARYDEFKTEEAEIVLMLRKGTVEPGDGHTLPFPALVMKDDQDAPPPATAVYVADRFGELFATYQLTAEASLPAPDDLLEWLRFIELQCPE